MSAYAVICPRDDAPAKQASSWCDDLRQVLDHKGGHKIVACVDDRSPADSATIANALASPCSLLLYFGHGTDGEWLTLSAATIDRSTIGAAAGKAVVSIACNTSRALGPDAITAGVRSWLGFTFPVPVLSSVNRRDVLGEAVAAGLSCLAFNASMQQARDELVRELSQMVHELQYGVLSQHPGAEVGMFLVECLRQHVALNGDAKHVPL